MARDAERLLKAVVSDYPQKQDKFYIANDPDGSFAIPEGTAGNTFFTGWGGNKRVTFEFGTGTSAIATRQVVAVLRFKRDTTEATYGYVLDALELPPPKKASSRTRFHACPGSDCQRFKRGQTILHPCLHTGHRSERHGHARVQGGASKQPCYRATDTRAGRLLSQGPVAGAV